MNADGSQPVRLTDRPDESTTSPVWSPNGKKIAFQRFVISRDTGNFDIFSMRPGPEGPTNRAVNLTRTPAEEESSPSWQPLP